MVRERGPGVNGVMLAAGTAAGGGNLGEKPPAYQGEQAKLLLRRYAGLAEHLLAKHVSPRGSPTGGLSASAVTCLLPNPKNASFAVVDHALAAWLRPPLAR